MDIIKELCAWLPRNNPRGVWEQFGMRDYLSVTTWFVEHRKPSENGDYVDFFLETTTTDMPGTFQVRTNYACTMVMDFFRVNQPMDDPAMKEKADLLFSLAFHGNMALKLKRVQLIDHPDAGSW